MDSKPGMAPDGGWVTIAILSRSWGRRGELSAVSLTRPERYQDLRKVFLFSAAGLPEEPSPMEVEWVWEHRGQPVFKFRGVDSISEAEPLAGAEVRIPAEQRAELPPGEFYHSDLIGCDMIDRRTGQRIGTVRDLQEHGGPGLLVVETPEGELLVPFAKAICVEIDTAARRILVDLPEGLKELSVG